LRTSSVVGAGEKFIAQQMRTMLWVASICWTVRKVQNRSLGLPSALPHRDGMGTWLQVRVGAGRTQRRCAKGHRLNLTLTQRLSIVFSVLLPACCGASACLQIRASDLHEKEVIQGLSRGLAGHIALDAALTDTNGLRPDAVRGLFGQLMGVNPSVEVYLLDNAGRIKGYDAPAGHLRRDRVDLEPVRRLLDGAPLPVLGDDPRSVDGRKVFSVAPLRGAGGEPLGYIYLVLLGETHDQLAAHVAANTVLRTTLWSMALVAVLGLLAGVMAFGLITRPLRRLSHAMRQLTPMANRTRNRAFPDRRRRDSATRSRCWKRLLRRWPSASASNGVP